MGRGSVPCVPVGVFGLLGWSTQADADSRWCRATRRRGGRTGLLLPLLVGLKVETYPMRRAISSRPRQQPQGGHLISQGKDGARVPVRPLHGLAVALESGSPL